MKRIIYLLALSFSITSIIAQENNTLMFDSLNISDKSLTQTENSFISLFGNPDSTSNYINEIGNETWINLKYSENSFYFYDDKLVSFELKNDSFYFYDPSIKVGADLSGINNYFQNSYMNREVINSIGFIIIDILMNDGSKSDSFIVINYNSTNNIINAIKLGNK